MSDNAFDKLPQHAKDQFHKMKEDGDRFAKERQLAAEKAFASRPKQSIIVPLVKRIVPIKPELRDNEQGREAAKVTMIPLGPNGAPLPTNPTPTTKMSTTPATFDSFQAFYNFLIQHPEIVEGREELATFTKFVGDIPKQCGCVHGTLRERARDMYGKMLPVIQVKYPEVFAQIKAITNLEKISFTDSDIHLLEV